MQKILESNIPALYAEDGFIHSIKSPIFHQNRREYRLGYSITIDALSFYFDATQSSSLENELNSEYTFSKAEIDRAQKLIAYIVKNKLTKYNGQPEIPDLKIDTDKFKSCVLVVDQVCNDYSIIKGYADQNTFITMLDAAIEENPNALILVKVHPVMLENSYINTRKNHNFGHYMDYHVRANDSDRVKYIASPANPYSILALVQKVYVCSSLLGFEALMAGKEVHIWGSPFYAGWGLGIQRSQSPAIERRTKKRTLEEIFLAAYIHFSRYLNPFTWQRCELEELLQSMVILRGRYFTYLEQAKSGFRDFTELQLSESIPIVIVVDESRPVQTILAVSSLLLGDPVNKYYVYCLSTSVLPPNLQKNIRNIAAAHKNLAGLEFISSNRESLSQVYPGKSAIKLLKF